MRHPARVALALAALAVAGASPAAARPISIFLLRGELLQRVERQVPPDKGVRVMAIRRLLAGPTPAERRDGITTDVPAGTVLTRFTLEHGVAVVRLTNQFRAHATRGAGLPRVAQLVATLTRLQGVRRVEVVLGDEPSPTPPTGVTLRDLPTRGEVPPVPTTVAEVQRILASLTYLPAHGAVSGVLDYRTAQALLAFQGWQGLPRSGVVDSATRLALAKAGPPRPTVPSTGRRVEVYRDRSVALLIQGGRVWRAMHVSSGRPGLATPAGNWSVYRKERYSWSVPFSVEMPYANYFHGGDALHEAPDVPAYPASHGCVRIGSPDAPVMWDFAAYGTPVTVY